MRALLFLVLFSTAMMASAVERLQVVSSVLPISLMVRDIGGDAVDSQLLLPASVSPHDYQLRPSDMKRLLDADLFFWVGPGLEHGLIKAARRHKYSIALFPRLKSAEDPHVWLDLPLIQEMARHIASSLSRRMPTRGAYFHANAARLISELRQYDIALTERLKHTPDFPYLLVHDGFSRFESHYGLGPGAVIMKSEDQLPGARHIAELRGALQRGDYRCVFAEQQYSPALLGALLEGLSVPVIELDILGMRLDAAEGFLLLYSAVADAYLSCAVKTGLVSGSWPAIAPARLSSLSDKHRVEGHVELYSQVR